MSAPIARLVAWRLVVAASGLAGVVLAAAQYDVWWTALSQLASLAVAASYVGLAAHAATTGRVERSPWLRGALATLTTLVCVGFLAMQHGNLLDPYSVFEHLLTPVLVVVDYLLVGRGRLPARRWLPLTWALVPLPYLAWYVVADLGTYARPRPGPPRRDGPARGGPGRSHPRRRVRRAGRGQRPVAARASSQGA